MALRVLNAKIITDMPWRTTVIGISVILVAKLICGDMPIISLYSTYVRIILCANGMLFKFKTIPAGMSV